MAHAPDRLIFTAAAVSLLLAGCNRPKDRTAEVAPPPPGAAAPAAGTPAAPANGVAANPPLSANMSLKPQFPGFYLDHLGTQLDPLHKPATVASGAPLTLDGFGYDSVAKTPAKGVDLDIDGQLYGTAYGTPRRDVANYNKVPGLVPVGFKTTLPPGTLKPGAHQVVVRVVAADGSGYYQSPTIKFTVQ